MVARFLRAFAGEGADGFDDGGQVLLVRQPPGGEVGDGPVGDEAGAEGGGEDVALGEEGLVSLLLFFWRGGWVGYCSSVRDRLTLGFRTSRASAGTTSCASRRVAGTGIPGQGSLGLGG